MKERLEKLLVSEKLTPARFAEVIGVQRSSISHIISGRNKPSYDMIHAILKAFPQLSPDWLVLGSGSMYRRMVQASLFDQPNPTEPPQSEPQEPLADVASALRPESQQEDEPAQQYDPSKSIVGKAIERVIVFYSDSSFREYRPSNST